MRRLFAVACLALAAACSASPDEAPAGPVTIFAAASLESALTDVDATVLQRNGRRVRLTFAGTPQLARQIEAGAPADIFISADERWMDVLVRQHHVQADSRRVLLGNTLILIAPHTAQVSVDVASAASLRTALGDGRLAIADPDNVPAGRYAREALTHAGTWDALTDRLGQSGVATAPRYRLDVVLDDKLEGLGLLTDDSVGRERRTLRARYQLVDLASDTIVLDTTAGSDAGIDVVSSEYATIAAEDTALENLARDVADRIVARLALKLRAES